MNCTHCGQINESGSRFCEGCGAPMDPEIAPPQPDSKPIPVPKTQPDIAAHSARRETRARKKPNVAAALLGVLCVMLASVAVLMAFGVTDTMFAPQQPAFQQPEDAIEYFMSRAKQGDYDGALAACPVKQVAQNYDFEAMADRLQAISPVIQYLPSEYDMYEAYNEDSMEFMIMRQLSFMAMSVSLPEEYAKLFDGSSLSEDDIDLEEAVNDMNPEKFSGIEIVEIDEPETLDSETVQDTLEKQAKFCGADEATLRAILFKVDGDYYVGGFTLLKYDNRWLVYSLYDNSIGQSFLGALIPIDDKSDFKDMISGDAIAIEIPETTASAAPSEVPATAEVTEAPAQKPYIAVICKGFQHPFWQTVMSGAEAAANENGVDMTFEGPPTESDISIQVDMLNAALSKNPDAICIAALDTESVIEQLKLCKEKGIPVIGLDSGVPDAPEGCIVSTAAMDNEAAGALAAEEMIGVGSIKTAVEEATKKHPVVISVLSSGTTHASLVGRTTGFVQEMYDLCNDIQPGLVEITGNECWAKASESGDVAIEIFVSIADSYDYDDSQVAAEAALDKNPIGVFCTYSGTVDGILAATGDSDGVGSELDRTDGKYKDLIVIGFDAGAAQLDAVRKEWFYGSITQDSYMIGYQAVTLAVMTLNGESVPMFKDTGCCFYSHENMDDPDIARLLYE